MESLGIEGSSGRSSESITEPLNKRSRRTRESLLASARTILERDGFTGLTMAEVAKESGVTRRTVYLHFETRGKLVTALFDHNAATEGLHESVARVWAAPDGPSALHEWARHLARYHPRLIAVDRAIQQAHRTDTDVAALRERVVAAKLENCRRLARWLDEEQRLAPGWTARSATDMLFALISSDVIEGLTVDRHWSSRRLADHLALMFRSTFVTGPPEGP